MLGRLLAVLAVVSLTSPALASHTGGPSCNLIAEQPPSGVKTPYLVAPGQTCSAAAGALSCSVGTPWAHKNFLWTMADDQGYCMYRFKREPGAGDPANALRLADPTCRYRTSDDQPGDNAFVFDRAHADPIDLGACVTGVTGCSPGGYCCQRRYCSDSFATECGPGGSCSSGYCVPPRPCAPTDAQACQTLLTPTLDMLAADGFVFPNTHTPANSCVPSWKGVSTGRNLKDIQASLASGSLRACEHPDGCTDTGSGAPVACPDDLAGGLDTACESADSCGSEPCDNIRTFARLLHEHDEKNYTTFMAGKLRDGGNGIHGYNNCDSFQKDTTETIGMISAGQCSYGTPCDSATNADLADGDVDSGAIHPDVRLRLQKFTNWLNTLPLDSNRRLKYPFLIGWAPMNPHDGQHVNPPPAFRRPYFVCDAQKTGNGQCNTASYCWNEKHFGDCLTPVAGRSTEAAETFARVTMADYMLGVMIDELKRRCVCDGSATPKSLYDLTVVSHHSDHGAFMPNAKNQVPTSNLMRGENGYRTTMVVNDPAHRTPAAPVSTVFDGQLTQTIDLFATMVDRFDDNPSAIPSDLKGRDLYALMSAPDAPCSSNADCAGVGPCGFDGRCRTREVMITQGQLSTNNEPFPGWLVRVAPGLLGTCITPTQQFGPLFNHRYCVEESDCDELGASSTCLRAAENETFARVCMNWPGLPSVLGACETDLHCGPGLCNSSAPGSGCVAGQNGTCVGAPAGFADFQGKCCTNDGFAEECVAQNACMLPSVKYGVWRTGSGWPLSDTNSQHFAYDLAADPDEWTDRAHPETGAPIIGDCLRCKLNYCIEKWETCGPENTGSGCSAIDGCLSATTVCQTQCS